MLRVTLYYNTYLWPAYERTIHLEERKTATRWSGGVCLALEAHVTGHVQRIVRQSFSRRYVPLTRFFIHGCLVLFITRFNREKRETEKKEKES